MTSHDSQSHRSVTEWLLELKEGAQGEPQEQIVARFLHRLEKLARARMKNFRTYEDEQDVALSAVHSFLRRVPTNQYAWLTDRQSLWTLLAAITVNKAITAQRKQLADRRDVRREMRFDAVLAGEPSDDFLNSVIGEGNYLLESLEDPLLRKIAQMRLEGYTNEEIAQAIERSVTTVERKLQLIRKRLRAEIDLSGLGDPSDE